MDASNVVLISAILVLFLCIGLLKAFARTQSKILRKTRDEMQKCGVRDSQHR